VPYSHAVELGLTPREIEVAKLCLFYTAREIADQLGISERTVQVHIAAARTKSGTKSKMELGRFVMQFDVSDLAA